MGYAPRKDLGKPRFVISTVAGDKQLILWIFAASSLRQ